MLKYIEYTALAAALVFVGCLFALIFFYSSPFSPTQTPQQQHSEEHKPKNDAAEAGKSIWQRTWTDPIAFFTLWLVVFTAVLSAVGVIQLKLLGRAETVAEKSAQAAKDAADAAKQSADAIANVERPYIFVTAKPDVIASKDSNSNATPKILYSLHNIGRVPAIIRLVYAECFLTDKLEPQQQTAMEKFREAQTAIAAGNEIASFPACEFEKPFTVEDWAVLRDSKKMPIFMAIFAYEGALNFTYIVSATYRIDVFTGGAYAIGGFAYNYDESQEGRTSSGKVPLVLHKAFIKKVPNPTPLEPQAK